MTNVGRGDFTLHLSASSKTSRLSKGILCARSNNAGTMSDWSLESNIRVGFESTNHPHFGANRDLWIVVMQIRDYLVVAPSDGQTLRAPTGPIYSTLRIWAWHAWMGDRGGMKEYAMGEVM